MKNILKKAIFVWLILVCILGLSCHKNPVDDGGGGTDFGIVPRSPYDSPVWHPSGEFIGFNHTPLKQITYPNGEGSWGNQEFDYDSTGFWLIDPDGTNMRRILLYTLQTPAWSPDGEWIAFVSNVQIYKMRFTGSAFDTTTVVQLTTSGRNFFPAWSPDGERIAYDTNNSSNNGMNFIWKMKSDGSKKVRLVYEPEIGEIRMPSWSPSNDRIVHQRYVEGGDPEIFTMDDLGQNACRLTDNNYFDSHPHYSPDGKKIAFGSNGYVWIMDSTGTGLRQITTKEVDTDFGLPFSWSPAGAEIVYTRYNPSDWTYENGDLWIINTLTGEERQLAYNVKPGN